MNAAQHTAQRDAVRASLACTHHPDVYLSRGTNARPMMQRSDKGAGEKATASPPSDRVVEWPPESTRGESMTTGRDGGLPAPSTSTCTCGHLEGDHQHSGSRSLSAAALANAHGLCLIAGCDCARFLDAPTPRFVPGTPRWS